MNLSPLNAHYDSQKMINVPSIHQGTVGVVRHRDDTIKNGHDILLRSLDGDSELGKKIRCRWLAEYFAEPSIDTEGKSA